MGNFISCGTSPKVMSSRPTRVIFQNGKIQKFNEPIIAAELMLESPNSFLVNSSSLIVGRRFPALSADEELEFGNIYIMFPMKKVNSVITTKDIISVGKPGLENEAKVGRSPEKDGVRLLGFPVRQEFRKPLLETIMEEQVISSRWGINTDSICAMCKAEPETHQHLFFACSVANVIWQRLLQWMSITRSSAGWTEEIEWATLHANRKSIQDEVYRMTLAAALYYIWQERNHRIFQQKERSIEEIIKQIIQEIHCRSSMNPRLASAMHKLNFYP